MRFWSLPLFTQPFFSSRYKKLSTVAGAQPLAASFSPMSRRVAGGRQAQTASSTCSSAGERGWQCSGIPYMGTPPFKKIPFTIVSDASILPESTPKRKSGKSSGHAVILYLFYRCLRICSYTTNVCALCDFNADRNAASLCKDALVLHPSEPVYYGQIQNTNAAKVRAAFP